MSSLFYNLAGLTQTKLSLVTFVKAVHFLLPDIFMPIDRRYTLQFYYVNAFNRTNSMENVIDSSEKECLHQAFEDYRQFYQKHHALLVAQVDKTSRWS